MKAPESLPNVAGAPGMAEGLDVCQTAAAKAAMLKHALIDDRYAQVSEPSNGHVRVLRSGRTPGVFGIQGEPKTPLLQRFKEAAKRDVTPDALASEPRGQGPAI